MIGLLTIGLIGMALCKKRGVAGIGYRAFGGNSGYDGYSMSVRARNARAEGKYPKTDFRKIYHLTTAAFDALVRTRYILNSEWPIPASLETELSFTNGINLNWQHSIWKIKNK